MDPKPSANRERMGHQDSSGCHSNGHDSGRSSGNTHNTLCSRSLLENWGALREKLPMIIVKALRRLN
jgi:hypothetical protein